MAAFVPRDWQFKSKNQVVNSAKNGARTALVEACPGSGKTYGGLYIAKELREVFPYRKILILTPGQQIRSQWVNSGPVTGIDLIDLTKPRDLGTDQLSFVDTNFVMTYQLIAHRTNGAARAVKAFCERHRPIVILDEVHHTASGFEDGGNDWGATVEDALSSASFVLCLTGTPFRQSGDKIAFVSYQPDKDGRLIAHAIDRYTYAEAVHDGVCRQIEFRVFDADVAWRMGAEAGTATYRAGDDDGEDPGTKGLRAVWDATSPLCREMLINAHEKLLEVRDGPLEIDKSAAGLLVARDKKHADELAGLLENITGEPPIVVHDGIPGASDLIDQFRTSDKRWIIAVSMISEGVDIKRLRVCVYAGLKRGELYFQQLCGRIMRVQGDVGTPQAKSEVSYFFMVADTVLESHALEILKGKAVALKDEIPTQLERVAIGKGARKQPPKLTVLRAEGRQGGTIVDGNLFTPEFMSIPEIRDGIRGYRKRFYAESHLSDETIARKLVILNPALPKPEGWTEDAA